MHPSPPRSSQLKGLRLSPPPKISWGPFSLVTDGWLYKKSKGEGRREGNGAEKNILNDQVTNIYAATITNREATDTVDLLGEIPNLIQTELWPNLTNVCNQTQLDRPFLEQDSCRPKRDPHSTVTLRSVGSQQRNQASDRPKAKRPPLPKKKDKKKLQRKRGTQETSPRFPSVPATTTATSKYRSVLCHRFLLLLVRWRCCHHLTRPHRSEQKSGGGGGGVGGWTGTSTKQKKRSEPPSVGGRHSKTALGWTWPL